MSSLGDKVLGLSDLKEKTVRVEAWDVTFLMREPDGLLRATLVELVHGKSEAEVAAAMLRNAGVILRQCLFDPTSKEPVFTEEQEPAVSAKNPDVLQWLLNELVELGGMGQDAVEGAKSG